LYKLRETDIVYFRDKNEIFTIISNFIAVNGSNIRIFSYLLFVQLFVLAVGFFTQIKIANTLGRELFGQLAYGLAIGIYGQVFIRFGLDRTLVRDLVHHPEKTENIVAASLTLRYALSVFLIFALVLWKHFFAVDISWGLLLVIIGFSILSLDLQPVYDAWKKIPRHTTYYLIQKIIYFTVVWFIVLFFPNSLSINLIGTAVLSSAIVFLFLQHNWVANAMIDRTEIRYSFFAAYELGRQNILVWFTAFGGLFIVYFNQLILKYYAGFSELGSYAAAWQIVMLGMLFLDQIARIGNPATAYYTKRDVPPRARATFIMKYVSIMMIAISPIVLVMLVFQTLVFELLFKPEYAPASTLLPIFAIYLILVSVGYVASQYLLAARKEQYYFFSILIGAIASVLLGVSIIPCYGAWGAALTICVSHALTILINIACMFYNLKKEDEQ
jgi:O-antigen/teichoic acid export membrane protein